MAGAMELAHANVELGARQELVTSQNQVLQTQTAELAAHAERLRGANQELRRRQQILEALLDLARSLTSDMTRQQMMERICRVIGPLLGEQVHAAAILEMRDGRLNVRGHYGLRAARAGSAGVVG